jgi:LmbE family N-acetylglucosaminyl deacetylase
MTVLHISPHPDDETIGCGGALLSHIHAGDAVHWLIVTELTPESGHAPQAIQRREDEITAVACAYRFAGTHRLGYADSRLDVLPLAQLVDHIGAVVREVEASVIYVPHPGDVHSDHRVVFDAAIPCTKWFRFPTVRRVFAYETLSETSFGLDPNRRSFRPNVYKDVSVHLEQKLAILRLYAQSELAEHPFPRSEAAVRALALIRGSDAGYPAAEAFMLLRDIG